MYNHQYRQQENMIAWHIMTIGNQHKPGLSRAFLRDITKMGVQVGWSRTILLFDYCTYGKTLMFHSHVKVPQRRVCSPPASWGLLDFIRAVLLILLLLRLLLLLFLLLQFLLDHVCINFHVHFRLANSSPISSPTSARSGHCWTSTAGFRSEWAWLDLNRQVLSAVGTAGPQPPGSERSGHRWTSTGGFRAQWAPLDLNLGPSELSGHRWTSTAR